jgi:hypothetical protein
MKNIFDYKHVKSVRVYILQDKTTCGIRGKIISNWSDNPNGSVCTTQIISYDHPETVIKSSEDRTIYPLVLENPSMGRAGGYGYDKESSALSQALMKQGFSVRFSGAGIESQQCREFFDKYNLEIISIL